jgi:hypothetical protein
VNGASWQNTRQKSTRRHAVLHAVLSDKPLYALDYLS